MLVKEHVIDSPKQKEESLRYPIPSFFNPSPYYVYKAVRQLLDRKDIPPCHRSAKSNFIDYFTNILHYGVNAENEYNDHLKNLPLIIMCGNVFDEELDHNFAANSYFLKLALNMLRDYIDSMSKVGDSDSDSDRSQAIRQASFFEHDKYKIEQIIETIETYLHYLIDPDSKIETDGESEESDSSDSSDKAQGTGQD